MLKYNNYSLISSILDYFILDPKNYEFLDLPWLINTYFESATLPEDRLSNKFIHSDKTFVGSAEQSFIEFVSKNKATKNKKYISCTPCVRLDDNKDIYHIKQYNK